MPQFTPRDYSPFFLAGQSILALILHRTISRFARNRCIMRNVSLIEFVGSHNCPDMVLGMVM